jgi:hypothetical protein
LPFPALTDETAKARKEPIVLVKLRREPNEFVELDRRRDGGFTVSLEWNRETGNTRIVVAESQTTNQLAFFVPGAKAGDAFRHPFRYAP